MDFLDLCKGKFYQLHNGTYYARLPQIGEQIKEELPRAVENPNMFYLDDSTLNDVGEYLDNSNVSKAQKIPSIMRVEKDIPFPSLSRFAAVLGDYTLTASAHVEEYGTYIEFYSNVVISDGFTIREFIAKSKSDLDATIVYTPSVNSDTVTIAYTLLGYKDSGDPNLPYVRITAFRYTVKLKDLNYFFALQQGDNPGMYFDYEFVDPTSWPYKQIIPNLSDDVYATATIKTKDALGFKDRSFVMLDNGRLCQIVSIIEDTRAAEREAVALFPVPVGTEYILRLVEISNDWGI